MFDGDPQARAKDRDRDRAVYVVDAALRNGQITQQDRDLRVERARAAHTIGELETLTHDIASPPAPMPPTAVVPPPVAARDAGRPRSPVSPLTSTALPPTATKTVAAGTGLTTKANPAGRKIALGCGAVGLLFFIVPIIFGVVVFASQSSDTFIAEETEPIPAGPPFELSGPGLRQYVAAFEETFDDTEVVRLSSTTGTSSRGCRRTTARSPSGTTSTAPSASSASRWTTTSTPRRSTWPTSSPRR